MTNLNVLDSSTAPEGSREILEQTQRKLGFVPNLYGVFAGAPAALTAYTQIDATFGSSSLSPTEQQVVLLSASFENECEYCIAAHSTISGMVGVASDVVSALRTGAPLADTKLAALREFTRAVADQRGRLDPAQVQAFLAAGYTQANILEVIVGIAQKTLSNYTNHLAETPLDAAFQPQAWSPLAAAPQAATA